MFGGSRHDIDDRTATLMTNEKVLVAGGLPGLLATLADFPLSRAELYDPVHWNVYGYEFHACCQDGACRNLCRTARS